MVKKSLNNRGKNNDFQILKLFGKYFRIFQTDRRKSGASFGKE